MRTLWISLIILLLFTAIAATARADDPLQKNSKYDKYIKTEPQLSEYVNVIAPPYPGLEMEILRPEDSWMKKPQEPWKASISDLTADVTHQSTRHGLGFYSPRGYTSGQVISVPVVKK